MLQKSITIINNLHFDVYSFEKMQISTQTLKPWQKFIGQTKQNNRREAITVSQHDLMTRLFVVILSFELLVKIWAEVIFFSFLIYAIILLGWRYVNLYFIGFDNHVSFYGMHNTAPSLYHIIHTNITSSDYIFCLTFGIETLRIIAICTCIGWKWSIIDRSCSYARSPITLPLPGYR